MSQKAPTYNWTCSACDGANAAGSSVCQACGCPAITNRALLDEWKAHGRIRPRKPSIAPDPTTTFFFGSFFGRSNSLTDAVCYCHGCALMMHLQDTECPHCGYNHSEPEKTYQWHHVADYTGRGLRHGTKYWLIFFVVVFGAAYLHLNTY